MTNPTERRNFWRAVFHAPVTLFTNERTVQAQLLDISLKGALLETDNGWHGKPGEEWSLDLTLAPEAKIMMKTTVVRMDGHHIGLKCENIDLESIAHLCRLVEVNSGDPEILEREISKLLHDA